MSTAPVSRNRPRAQSTLAITNAHVIPIDAEPFDGTLVVKGGRISALGPKMKIPAGAAVIDAAGAWLLPGFIDAHVHLGMHPEGEVGSTSDVNEMTDPNMAAVRAIDAVDPFDPGFDDALAGGRGRRRNIHHHGPSGVAGELPGPPVHAGGYGAVER